jgi:pimeloyl-ACP methyl ester carboxylesterase
MTDGSRMAEVAQFDVGGYKLAAEIAGDGAPAVVFSSGLGDTGETWDAAISEMQSRVQLVTYARAGIGDSDALVDPKSQSFGAAAEELRGFLKVADVAGPYVLVGHSIGALIAQVFAARWPEELAGLVLVDPSDVQLWLEIEKPKFLIADGDREDHASFDIQVGAEEIAASRRTLDVPAVVVSSRVGRWLDSKTPNLWQPFSLRALDERWQRKHRELAADLGALQKVARVGGHYVQNDEPRLVAEAIDAVVQSHQSIHEQDRSSAEDLAP